MKKRNPRSRLHSHSSGALLRFVVLLISPSANLNLCIFEGKRNANPCPRLDMQEEATDVSARLVRMSGLAS